MQMTSSLTTSRAKGLPPRSVSAPYVFHVHAQAPAPAPDQGPAPVQVPTTAPDLDLVALAGQSGPFMFGRGKGRFPPQVFAPDLPQVGAREESRFGRVEETAPEGMLYGLYPRQIESEDSERSPRWSPCPTPWRQWVPHRSGGTLWSLRELERPAG
ncbi:hypothetical protein AAFF_G00430880 [Aldrovandia affinis]|uniref:Uncharacterized protein n=1 Tax=Aldrovandia affinis TaxID=143900 RepID=A0AAD7VY58_9TELE|nr:hypothetical protein AAFF_G00430880 [Aldrovandia affinis]